MQDYLTKIKTVATEFARRDRTVSEINLVGRRLLGLTFAGLKSRQLALQSEPPEHPDTSLLYVWVPLDPSIQRLGIFVGYTNPKLGRKRRLFGHSVMLPSFCQDLYELVSLYQQGQKGAVLYLTTLDPR